MPEPLTKLERRILDFLIEYLCTNTYQPSIREIGRRFNIKSTKTVSEYLQALADKGWIERDPSRSRGVRVLVLDLFSETVKVPVYDGARRDASPEPDGDGEVSTLEGFELDRRLAGAEGTFLMSMNGDSMEGAGIRPGDLLLVEPAAVDELENSDVVVARLEGDVDVKRFTRDGETTVLEPAHPDYDPVVIEAGQELMLLGRVIGVVRQIRTPLRSAPASASAAGAAEEGAAA